MKVQRVGGSVFVVLSSMILLFSLIPSPMIAFADSLRVLFVCDQWYTMFGVNRARDDYSSAIALAKNYGWEVNVVATAPSSLDIYDVIIHVIHDDYYGEKFRSYVQSGGGLLLIPWYHYDHDQYEALLANFGALINYDLPGSGNVTIAEYEITHNVWNLKDISGPPLIITNPSVVPFIFTDDPFGWHTDENLPLMAYRDYFEGRVVLNCLFRLFSNKYLDHGDNWILFLNTLFWLANEQIPEIDVRIPELKSLQDEIDALNARISELEQDILALEDIKDKIEEENEEIINGSSIVVSLKEQLTELSALYGILNSSYQELQSDYSTLEGSYANSQRLSQLSSIFIVTTLVFVATTIFFAKRKPGARSVSSSRKN